MPAKKITYVVGAGASREVGLPDGHTLKGEIRTLLDVWFDEFGRLERGDRDIVEALRLVAAERNAGNQNINEFLPALRLISQALPQAISIDNFLDNHDGNAEVSLAGKLAITSSILRAERKSILNAKTESGVPLLNSEAVGKTWLHFLFQLITEGCKAAELERRLSNYSFIVFNYDRCIEQFFSLAIQNFFGLSAADSLGITSRLRVIHPYGSVGDIFAEAPTRIEFGADVRGHQLLSISNGLRTFTERVDAHSETLDSLRATVAESDVLMFLGFAYHKQNIELLGKESYPVRRQRTACIGTAFNVSSQNVNVIRSDLYSHLDIDSSAIELVSLKCADAMQAFWRQLSVR